MQEKISLSEYCTFKIGGNANYFLNIQNLDDLIFAKHFAMSHGLKIFVLGGGSNVLFSDRGFDGLVIRMINKDIKIKNVPDYVSVEVLAGVNWDQFVKYLVSRDISGLENLSLIPGSVGASPIQNIGAYGVEVSDVIEAVEVYDLRSGRKFHLTGRECSFSYRDSIFKRVENKNLVVLKVIFKLKKKFDPNISYKELSEYFKKRKIDPSIREIRKHVIKIRKEKLPDIKKYGTAGSFFKNPIIPRKIYEEIRKRYPEITCVELRNGDVKISAAYLIDKIAGLKNLRVGKAFVWGKQTLVIACDEGATYSNVINLKEKIKNKVFELTKIKLNEEVIII